MEDTDWRPSACPNCGRLRAAAKYPVCTNSLCSMNGISKTTDTDINKMITAKEARELAGPSFNEIVEEQLGFAYERIKLAAENKHRSVNLTNEFWIRDGYNGTDEYKAAVKQLKVLGYTVNFHYEERQFVDMYTIVEW